MESSLGHQQQDQSQYTQPDGCTLIPHTRGEILQNGVRPSSLGRKAMREHRRDFQILFQDPNAALNPRMRIIDSVL